MNGRFAAVKATVSDAIKDIGRVATFEEIRTLIVTTCHLAGELADANGDNHSRNKSTCLPLRLAGLDLAFVWEDEDIVEYKATIRRAEANGGDMMLPEVAELLVKNAQNGNGMVTFGRDDSKGSSAGSASGSSTSNNERDYDAYGDDDYHRYHDDDGYHHDEDDEEDYHRGEDDGVEGRAVVAADEDDQGAELESDENKEARRAAITSSIASARLSASRSPFVSQANALKEKIDSLLTESEDNATDGEDVDEKIENDDEKEESTTTKKEDPRYQRQRPPRHPLFL